MRTVAAAIGLSIALSGCSLFAARAPDPRRAAGSAPDCNPGKGTVGLDGTMAVLLGIGAIAAFADDEPGLGVGFGLASLGYGAAGMHGAKSASRCRAAIASYQPEEAPADRWVTAPMSPAPTVEPYPEAEAEAETETEAEAETETETETQAVAEGPWMDFWKVTR